MPQVTNPSSLGGTITMRIEAMHHAYFSQIGISAKKYQTVNSETFKERGKKTYDLINEGIHAYNIPAGCYVI